MTDKQLAIQAIERLSDNATLADIRERIEFLQAIRSAEAGMERGEFVSHDDVGNALASWIEKFHSKFSGQNPPSAT